MAQVKVFALKTSLNPIKAQLSEVIHSCVVDALKYPEDKRAHRFFPLEPEDFFAPAGRSERYTIIEISMFEGRTTETKKRLLRLLYERIGQALGISAQDVEITLFETPKANWGIRGVPGDELELPYKVEV
jgi:phenylpyruvate tautomerase PptA (4-oxalocrotonate tautomerase family)